MTKFLFTPAFLLISHLAFAQASDVAVEWGPLIKSKDSDFDFIVGANDEFFYTFGSEDKGLFSGLKSKTYHVKKYSREDYQVKYDVVLGDFEYKGKNTTYSRAWVIAGEVHLFFNSYQADLDKKVMLRIIVDKDGEISQPEEVSTVPAEKRSEGKFILKRSRDSTQVLIYTDYPNDKKSNEEFGIRVLDNEFNLLWEKKLTLPYTDKYFTITNQAVTNAGDVFLVGYAVPDRTKGEKNKKHESNEDYKLFRISKDDEELVEFDLGLDDMFINSVSISGDFGDDLMAIAGFYSDKKAEQIGGSFYITINQKTLEAITASNETFSKDFMRNFLSDRKVEKGRGLSNFTFRNFIRREDGGAIAIAEQYFVTVHTYPIGNGMTQTTIYYNYNDIFIVNINPNGKIEWTAHVPKLQTSSDDHGFYSSYLLLLEKDRINFIFNDNPKNLDRLAQGKDIRGLGSPTKSMAILASVDKEGNVTREQLFNNRDVSAVLVPKRSIQVSNKEVIMFGIKKSKSRFGTMNFR